VDSNLPFAGFETGVNDRAGDAGIIYIDLAARVAAIESTYSRPGREGELQYHDGLKLTDVWLPYRVPGDWLFLYAVGEYKGVAGRRRAERAANQPLDARPVLFGAVVEFIARQCLAARAANARDPVSEIHAKWLMTPRGDLRGLAPREVMLQQLDDIDFDLQSRELQWSYLNEPAPCLKPQSGAYRYSGFGTHGVVVYYELVRHLITDCWQHVGKASEGSIDSELARLERAKTEWLESPNSDYGGKSPACILEYERTRLPWVSSEEDSILDDDCPWCRAMAAEELAPEFWHLDGSNMDDGFAFSRCRTRDEWVEEQLDQEEFDHQFADERRQEEDGQHSGVRPSDQTSF